MGELKQGSDPHIRVTESEEKHLRLRVKQLICGSLNGMRIRQSLPQPYTPQTGRQIPWETIHTPDREGAAAGSWSLVIVEQSQGEGCC